MQRCRGADVQRLRGEEEGRGAEVVQVQSFRGVVEVYRCIGADVKR